MRLAFGRDPLLNPKEGDVHLFVKFAWFPTSLLCGCVVWMRWYLKGRKFGNVLHRVIHGVETQWMYRTHCMQCTLRDTGKDSIPEFIVGEIDDGVQFHASSRARAALGLGDADA